MPTPPDPTHRRLPTALAVLTTLLLAGAPATAQEEAPAPDRWSTDMGLALSASGGNESLSVLTTSVAVTHLQKDAFEFGLNSHFRYGRSEGEEVARNARVALNFDLRPRAAWTPFVFASGENDPFRKLDLRFNGGAGLKRTFWQDDWSEVSLSAATLYSYENLDVEPGVDPVSRTARWSWRARGRRTLGERSRIEQIFYYQPELSHGDDYLLESVSTLRVGLTQALTLDLAFRYDRDSTPAPDVEPDDWALTTGIRVTTTW